MDEKLAKLDQDLRIAFNVFKGETPLFKISDAINLAMREGLATRWMQDGNTFYVWYDGTNSATVYKSDQADLVCRDIVERRRASVEPTRPATPRRTKRGPKATK